jgi:hypothetical protein
MCFKLSVAVLVLFTKQWINLESNRKIFDLEVDLMGVTSDCSSATSEAQQASSSCWAANTAVGFVTSSGCDFAKCWLWRDAPAASAWPPPPPPPPPRNLPDSHTLSLQIGTTTWIGARDVCTCFDFGIYEEFAVISTALNWAVSGSLGILPTCSGMLGNPPAQPSLFISTCREGEGTWKWNHLGPKVAGIAASQTGFSIAVISEFAAGLEVSLGSCTIMAQSWRSRIHAVDRTVPLPTALQVGW